MNYDSAFVFIDPCQSRHYNASVIPSAGMADGAEGDGYLMENVLNLLKTLE